MITKQSKGIGDMKKILQSKDFKICLIFSFIGLIASLSATLYQISIFSEAVKQEAISQIGSIEALLAVTALQGVLITFIFSFAGLKLARKVNLKLNFKFDKKAFALATAIGFATAFIITVSDILIFAKYLPPTVTSYVFSPIYLITGVLYGGIVEEILMRLTVMSLFVLILWKLFAKTKDYLNIPSWVYITAIIVSATLFAAGHLPITKQILGLSLPIVIRCFLLNGIGGLVFGYLYWKKGLAYSMYAHAIMHVFTQLIFLPILF